jgi:crotonobetainyl-CoA:carnitine CoA-transferase CaiB-like acyl-CoA transferase
VNPALITVSSCLMGQTGPLATMAGFGNLAGAISGFYEITGWPDRPPAGPFLAYTDYVSPRVTLAVVLAALDHRRRTGEAAAIDLAQQEAALQFLAPALLATAAGRGPARRVGNDDAAMAPHGVYRCAGDDRWVAIACQDDAAWRALADLVGRPHLGALATGDRLAGRRELDAVVEAWTTTRTDAEAEAACIGAGIAAHRVQNSPECLADPQLVHRRHFRRVPHRLHGETVVEGPHLTLSAADGGPRRAGPTLGEHNDEVLRGLLGYDDERVLALVVAGAVR